LDKVCAFSITITPVPENNWTNADVKRLGLFVVGWQKSTRSPLQVNYTMEIPPTHADFASISIMMP
jgi:hypothetical protein